MKTAIADLNDRLILGVLESLVIYLLTLVMLS